jgi:cobalt/nickel transport system permease protein
MHIPDGFLDLPTAATTAAVSAVAVGLCLRAVRRRLTPRQVPLMGLTATFVFAAQMLNFPVAGGTSGHLVGACLAAVLVGPWAALLVMTAVLVVQCLVFADGGILALGANVLNMAVIGSLVGGGLVGLLSRVFRGLRGRVVAAAFASWFAVVLAAAACAVELAASGAVPLRVVLPAMAAVHMVIGVGEAVITALVLVAIAAIRPELVTEGASGGRARRLDLVLGGVIVALLLAVFVAPFASSLPDGLERVAATLGFAGRGSESAAAPLAGYEVPGVSSPIVATALAGGLGTVVMLVVSILLGRLLVPPSREEGPGRGP